MTAVLADTKVGDELLLRDGLGGQFSVTVDRVTATRVMVGKEAFGRRRGKRVGDGDWSRCHVEPMTPDAARRLAEWKDHRKLTLRINSATTGLRCFRVSEENIERVESFLGSKGTA